MPARLLDAGTSLEISRLSGMKQTWLECFDGSGPVTVLLGSVERVDTAGLQFLLGLRHEAEAQRLHFTFDSPSEMLRSQAAVVGIDGELFGKQHESSTRP